MHFTLLKAEKKMIFSVYLNTRTVGAQRAAPKIDRRNGRSTLVGVQDNAVIHCDPQNHEL